MATTSSNSPEHESKNDIHLTNVADPIAPEVVQVGSLSEVSNLDDVILQANGHEAAMKRQFKWLSALGLAFSITNSWVGYFSVFGQNVIYGGSQVVIFALIVAWVVQSIIILGLSELASAFPSAGGQYHFCFILAPEKHKRFAAFVVGWMSMLAWWIVTASGLSLAAVSVLGVAHFFHPGYIQHAYQEWLVYVAVALLTMLPLFFAPNKIHLTVQATLFLSLIGAFVTFVIVLAMRQQEQPASFITRSGLGSSGWGSGTAWVLGITNAMYTFGGTDGVIHISEELVGPGRRVPQVIGATMLIGLLTTLPLFLALMFCVKDLDAVMSSPLPSLEIVYQVTGSKTATAFCIIWLVAIYILALCSQWVTAGRIAWAFARDGGVPFSAYFSKVDDRLGFPVRATLASFGFACIYGLLYLASTTAFNSIVTSAVLFLNITYVVPQGILLVQGRKKSLPARYLRLGYFGYFCNIFSVLFIVLLGVMVCMPPTLPVAIGTMNYTSVILVGLFAIILLCWFTVGRKFEGPHIQWDLINAANALATTKTSHA